MPSREPLAEILPLTGLRAVAAYAVVAFHFGRRVIPDDAWVASRLVSAGYLAVDLFFILSGYVLAHRYMATSFASRDAIGHFWRRRFARVYPLYVVSLLVGFAAGLPYSLRELAAPREILRVALQLGLLNAWSHISMFKWNWAAWSLSVEAFFYLLFPFLFPAVARLSRRGPWALLVVCWLATFIAPAIYGALDPDRLGHPFTLADDVHYGWYLKFFPLQRLPEFAAGAAAAVLAARGTVASPRLAPVVVAVIVAIVLSGRAPYAYLHSGALLPLFALLVAAVAARGPRRPLLASGPIVALGRASYATYILHVPLFLAMARFDRAMWQGARLGAYAAALVVVSLVAHRYVEEPARRALS